MPQDMEAVSGKKFFVVVSGTTNGAHQLIVEEFKKYGQTEVTSAGECDYLLVFCPVVSRVGTDISEALDHVPAGKKAVLVVMHHTFVRHHVIAPSSRLVENPDVLLTLDCLFHENKLLNCDLNDKMWSEVCNFLGVSQCSLWRISPRLSRKKFFVIIAGSTNGAHRLIVEEFKDKGWTEVASPGECDYLLVFCPVASRVGTDISEALNHVPAGKQAVLVVMHHTFDLHHVIAPSSRLVQNPNVLLTVDCLFHEDQLLNCDLNDKMWSEVYNFLGVSQNSRCRNSSRLSRKKFFVIVVGSTNGAHRPIVEGFKGEGWTEVTSPGECDCFLVFCAVASQVEKDISKARDHVPGMKILLSLVMLLVLYGIWKGRRRWPVAACLLIIGMLWGC